MAANLVRGDLSEALVLRENSEESASLGGEVATKSCIDAGLVTAGQVGAATNGACVFLTDLGLAAWEAGVQWAALEDVNIVIFEGICDLRSR